MRHAGWKILPIVVLVGMVTATPLRTLGPLQASSAAAPATGTITAASPTITYAGNHFTAANVSGQAGAPLCNAVVPAAQCDTFQVTLAVPSTYVDTHFVKVAISYPNPVFEYDLYIMDARGTIIKSSTSGSDPTVATFPAVSGVYTVTVVPFNPDLTTPPGAPSYTGAIDLTPNAPAAAGATQAAPSYANYPIPAALPAASSSFEPSIGADWNTGAAMYKAGRHTYRVTFDDTASPVTATWVEKTPLVSRISFDPILFTDHTTNRTFVSDLLPDKTSLYAFSDNAGESYTPGAGFGVNSGVDHQTIGGGPFATASAITTTPTTTYTHAVYYCSQDIVTAECALSRDGGLTFGVAIPIYNTTQCVGIHGHVKVAPDGTVYVPNRNCGPAQGVAVSTDNGLHWTVRTVPDSVSADWDPSVGIGSRGTVYFGYQNGDGHALVTVSHDQGRTWTPSVDVGAAFGIKNIVFPAVVAGDDNRAAFAFLGTKSGGDYAAFGVFPGVWHLYVAHTYDGGKTWVTTDATPNDPVQRGSICNKGTLCSNTPDDRNLADFMDATVDKYGRVLVGYADGCIGACDQGGDAGLAMNSATAFATIARSTGLGLYARYDPVVDLSVADGDLAFAPTAPAQGDRVRVTATIHNKGTLGSGASATRFYDGDPAAGGRQIGGDVATPGIAAGGSTTASTWWDTNNLSGAHTIYVVADATAATPDVDRSNNTARATVTVATNGGNGSR